MEWIKVEDCVPEENQKVIVYSPVVFCDSHIGRWDRVLSRYATHWMPYPEKPELASDFLEFLQEVEDAKSFHDHCTYWLIRDAEVAQVKELDVESILRKLDDHNEEYVRQLEDLRHKWTERSS